MAEPTVFKNGYVAWTTSTAGASYTEIAGVKTLSMPMSKAELPDGVMGDGGEVFKQGLFSVPVSVTARQDFTSGVLGVDKQAWNRWNSETRFKLKFRAVDAAVGAGNPTYILDRVGLFQHTPIDGQHGVLLENKLEFRPLSLCTITRSTTT